VREAQDKWAAGVVDIGRVYREGEDYVARAAKHVDKLYAYDLGPVLFKPTLATDVPFRPTAQMALSYFVGGEIAEDRGFALKPWRSVRFGDQRISLRGQTALAMGLYLFTPYGTDAPTQVEFTFGYIRDARGDLRINLHHSSMPFTPPLLQPIEGAIADG
ncbi:MAG: hypothetical protein AAGB25_06730, partial [Pseudomonadota bacterium]